LQSSSEDSKWWANIHGVEKYEVEEIERVEVYYEQIQKLAHGLQIPTIDNIFIIACKTGL